MSHLSERDLRSVWHPFTQHALDGPPIPIVSGSGARLVAEDGKSYVDAISSWWTVVHGHAHPHITARIREQLDRLHHVIFAGFTHEPAVELAERLLSILPGEFRKMFFSDNGSTAVEVALKMAVQYWHNLGEPRTKIVAFEDAYHGDTFGAMSAGAASVYNRPFAPLLFPVERIPAPIAGRELEAKRSLQAILEQGGVAAFLFEPLIQGAGGMLMHEPGPLDDLIDLCRQFGTLVIADEVMTGFGRTGKDFACCFLRNAPDIMCLSKGLTGGTLPLGATVATEEIFDAFSAPERAKCLLHGHTFTANPIACTAALASLDLFELDETRANIDRIAARHREFAATIANSPGAARVRAKGGVLAFDLEVPDSGYTSGIRNELYSFFLERKILLRPLGNVVYTMPPYCISDDDLTLVYEAMRSALERFGGRGR